MCLFFFRFRGSIEVATRAPMGMGHEVFGFQGVYRALGCIFIGVRRFGFMWVELLA